MLTALAILGAAALLGLATPARSHAASWICAAGTAAASVSGIAAAADVLAGAKPGPILAPGTVPGGAFLLDLDPLSAFFLLLICALAPAAALHGAGYLRRHAPDRGTRGASCLFCLLVASMIAVVAARHGILFLVAWETMTLASWALVASDHGRPDVRLAGRRYLIASQLAGACLVAFFAAGGGLAGGLAFSDLAAAAPGFAPAAAAPLLVLALLGFGTKAGLFPLHVWLPLAHPAAPSHVSALMSGVMIKMGIYGLLRAGLLFGPPPPALATVLILAGAVTAVYGIASALGQRDLKRALAGSSIENMGIAATGIGLAWLAGGLGHPGIAATAAAGVVLHLAGHLAMKGLLFLGAGNAAVAAHTRDLERLGGLLRRMPVTGTAFAAGAAGLAALPPFAGLAGEWLLLVSCFRAATAYPVDAAVLVALAGLALVAAGGLAAASSARLVGIAFLGEPRSAAAGAATECGPSMLLPPVALAAASLALGLFPAEAAAAFAPAIAAVAGTPEAAAAEAGRLVAPLAMVGRASALLAGAAAALLLLRARLPGLRAPAGPGTWGCGYARPSAKLQYTGSSFGRPLVGIFAALVKPRPAETRAAGVFPAEVRSATEVPDRVETGFYEPLFARIARWLSVVRRFQHGHTNKYVLQIVGALVAGLIWAAAWRWLERR